MLAVPEVNDLGGRSNIFLRILQMTKRLCPGIIMMYYMELALEGNDCLGMEWKSPLTFTSDNIGTIIGLSWI